MPPQETPPTEREKTSVITRIPVGLLRSPLSLIGTVLVTLSLANIIFLLLIAMFGSENKPYLGIFAFMIFPAILIVGLIMIPAGMLLRRYRRRKLAPDETPAYPKIDLNQPAQRRAFAYAIGFLMLMVVISAVLSYRAYQFTDSVAFCGAVCHAPMKPEYTAYQDSPHARVPCVGCHVGPGATWYVRSKLSGTYQVYSVFRDVYPRPITTPISDLRPVQQACEECHWPEKFYGAQLKIFNHFGYDKSNTPREIPLLIKTGGGSPNFGSTTGIHWHMNIAYKIWYIGKDPQSRVIPWVRVKDTEGRVTEYMAKDAKLTPAEIEQTPKHTMDCVSCHDRPAHRFLPPDAAIDQSLTSGKLDRSLPFIKRQAVQVLAKTYSSDEQAMEAIATSLDAFYRSDYPDIYAQRKVQIDQAITEVQQVYERNFFPYMKVDWHTHPDNIGHLYYPGCFRCHDGKHVSSDGRVIGQGCETCHTFLDTSQDGRPNMVAGGKPFAHPIDLKSISGMLCSTCHTGAAL
jgi:hypothetical protein